MEEADSLADCVVFGGPGGATFRARLNFSSSLAISGSAAINPSCCAHKCAREHPKRPLFYPTLPQQTIENPLKNLDFSRGRDAASWFRKPLLYPTELRSHGTVYHGIKYLCLLSRCAFYS